MSVPIDRHGQEQDLRKMGIVDREVVTIMLLERIADALERSAAADERAANPLEALTVAMATAERMEAESRQRTAGKPAQSVVEPPPIPLTPPPPRREDLPESEQWRIKQ